MGVPSIVVSGVNTLPLPIISHTFPDTTQSSHHFTTTLETIAERRTYERVTFD
jgi:hypothetical protein